MLNQFISLENLPILVIGVLFIVGIALLTWGGDLLTDGASDLAFRLHISPTIIGLTVVSFATSMPEFFTCFLSAFNGNHDLAVGNIVGSNLANIGLILGSAAIFCPILIQKRLVTWELPFLLGISLIFTFFCSDGKLASIEGIILLIVVVAYLAVLVRTSKLGTNDDVSIEEEQASPPDAHASITKSIILVLGGSVTLAIGAWLLVDTAVITATRFNVSETLIGLTVVAFGTSLPELSASIVAALRKESGLVAGNVIGSNLFNILFIGGSVSTYSSLRVDGILQQYEFPAMLLLTGVCWLFFTTERKVTRLEGIILIAIYFALIISTYLYRTGKITI